jgi:hypothetical protein
MKSYYFKIKTASAIALLACFFQTTGQTLDQNFKNPPDYAKPRTWMHAMSANMSKEGITKDFEAIADAGIGGVLLFNVAQGIPYGKIVYNSDEHIAIIRHAAMEAERLGIAFGVHNCDGWTSSGGPWITPENSMKMVVVSETVVKGGNALAIQLIQPTTRKGFYSDIAVIAYPSLSAEVLDFEAKPVVTSSDPKFDIKTVTDKILDNTTELKGSNTEKAWIQFDFGEPVSISSFFMLMVNNCELEIMKSDDGIAFSSVHSCNTVRTGKAEYGCNDHFNATRARYFRVVADRNPIKIKEVGLRSTYLMDNFLGRTSMARTENANLNPIGNPDRSMIIKQKDIIDLSGSMDKSGLLKTTLPSGNWTILRFGFTSTGAVNVPSSRDGQGLEVDKLSREAFKIHYDAFVGRVISATKAVAPNAMQYVEIDSYEVGGQNWTQGFENTFKKEYNYDLIQFMPLFAGRFVESVKTSDAVLWDFRKLVSQLMVNNYYNYFTELCHKDGIKSYVEPYGVGPFNNLDAGQIVDLPMGEFWMRREINVGQVSSPVSGARIYGKNVISAESFTAEQALNWKGHPALSKITGDIAWTYGINEFMFHRFAHQSNTHVSPGMTMNRWGSHIDRTQTWWENAGEAWFKYIARGSYLLRQGVPVSDLLVYVGEGSPNSVFGRKDFNPAIPNTINFDNVNTDVLLNRIKVQNGKLILPEGTSYKALVLKNCEKLSLKTVKRLNELAEQGIIIIGLKPLEPAGYMISKEQTDEFNALTTKIWAKKTTWSDFDWEKIFTENNINKDLVIGSRTDITFVHRKTAKEDVYFFYNPDSVAQRFICDFNIGDKIPELWNPMTGETKKLAQFTSKNGITSASIDLTSEASVFVVFRESSKNVAVVTSLTSASLPAPDFFLTKDNQLCMVISKNGKYNSVINGIQKWAVEVNDIPQPIVLSGSWKVSFNKESGYEGEETFASLTDWKDHPKEGVKYYSGTAIYAKSFNVPQESLAVDKKYELDLGKVSIAARVIVNGKDLGVLWMSPFRMDISSAIVAGQNELRIEVTNLWTNRLIGEERFPDTSGYTADANVPEKEMPAWFVNNEPQPAGRRTTFTTQPFYKATDPLVSSGLLGPVVINVQKNIQFSK